MAEVTVYSTSACAYCQMVKKYLDDNKVGYTNKDVAGDPDAGEEMVKKSGQMGVPVTDIDGQIVIGFNKEKLSVALGL